MICVSIGTKDFSKQFFFAKKFELIEYRIDLCNPDSNQLEKILKTGDKIIVSFRNFNDLNHYNNIDINNLFYYDMDQKLLKNFHEHENISKKLIISHHYDCFDLDIIQNDVNRSLEYHPKIIKIASFVKNEMELDLLMNLYNNDHLSGSIILGMGSAGNKSRVNALKYGAPFTYAAPEKNFETALGQLTFDEIKNLINE
jgi:3-dehydroquinate dehydratase